MVFEQFSGKDSGGDQGGGTFDAVLKNLMSPVKMLATMSDSIAKEFGTPSISGAGNMSTNMWSNLEQAVPAVFQNIGSKVDV